MLPVAGQCRPILGTKSLSLSKEATQIGSLGQFVAVDSLIDTVATHLILLLTHWYHVDTFARFQMDIPVVLGYASNDVVVR